MSGQVKGHTQPLLTGRYVGLVELVALLNCTEAEPCVLCGWVGVCGGVWRRGGYMLIFLHFVISINVILTAKSSKCIMYNVSKCIMYSP